MNQGFTVARMAEITGGKIIGNKNPEISELLTDSRRVVFPDKALFIALDGPNNDGHNFIGHAYNQGVRVFMVQENHDITSLPEASFLVVNNTLRALQSLAAAKRKLFRNTLIAVTGSNGKTIVKEWLSQLLSDGHKVYRSPGSYNSQLGVALSLWMMSPGSEFAVIEAGISKPGEMEYLERMIRPDIGIFTNLGDAHQEGFQNIHQKLSEKLILFRNVKKMVASADHVETFRVIREFCREKNISLFTWGKNGEADLRILETKSEQTGMAIVSMYRGRKFDTMIPAGDKASLENAMHVAATLIKLGIDPDRVFSQLKDIQPVAMRMEIKKGINNCLLINDFYNSDVNGLLSAIGFLKQQTVTDKKTLILSDILQSGRPESELYRDVASMVRAHRIDRFIGVGEGLGRYKDYFDRESRFYPSTEDFLQNLHEKDFHHEAILLKGARRFHFEEISSALEEQGHETVLDVNLDHLVHNFKFYKSLIQDQTRIMVMVKAFSYGSGMYEIARALEIHQADYLAVAYTDEGVALRKAGIRMPVMVMNAEPGQSKQLVNYNLEPVLYGFRQMNGFIRAFRKEGLTHYPVHLKLDTGMHRLGFLPRDADLLADIISAEEVIYVRSVFSHLAAADDPTEDDFTRAQCKTFRHMYRMIRRALSYDPVCHILNTSGIERFPEEQMDMVRLGLGLYGISNNHAESLKPVSTLKSVISQIKNVKAGETIGYNRMEKAEVDMQVAIVPVGYADGLPPALGNRKGSVYIAGTKVPVVGKVCMDMLMADVTNLKVREGDTVEIFGPNITVTELSKTAGTIPYDIIAGISARVKRNYLRENE